MVLGDLLLHISLSENRCNTTCLVFVKIKGQKPRDHENNTVMIILRPTCCALTMTHLTPIIAFAFSIRSSKKLSDFPQVYKASKW